MPDDTGNQSQQNMGASENDGIPDAVKETLNTVRTFHMTLFGLCAALLVFSINIEPVEWIEKSLTELDAAQNSTFKDFDQYVDQTIQSQFPTHYYLSLIKSAAEDVGIALPENMNAPLIPHSIILPNFTNRKLVECREKINDPAPQYVYLPDFDSFTDALYEIMQNAKEKGCHVLAAVLIERDPALPNIELLKLVFPPQTCNQKIDPIPIVFNEHLIEKGPQSLTLFQQCCQQWFEQVQPGLVDIKDGAVILFPDIEPAWDDVKNMTIADAQKELKRKRLKGGEKLKLGGIEFTQYNVILFAPPLIIAVLLYGIVYLAHLSDISKNHRQKIRGYPLFGLFLRRPACCFATASIILLPSLFESILIYKTWYWTSSLTWLSLVFLGITLILAIWLDSMIRRLRHDIYGN
ncbi:MAG TPA: hypothetical protein PLI09_11790 [Candidatus Hydrogenedentes bacterium]|nr:hypothetical protein [Candidatus Hydrogenedentota bacterium]